MKTKIFTFFLVIMLLFSCGMNAVFAQEAETFEETITEAITEVEPIAEPITEAQSELQPAAETPIEEPVQTVQEAVEETVSEPQWQGIDADELEHLSALYNTMTYTGKALSGWFNGENYAPCTWAGVACEGTRVSKLTFENAGYFTTFPEAILAFADLKELHMVDTLMRGVLPESLFEDLPKLEVLEISGNFLTGEIPQLPENFAAYPMLREITLSDNLKDDQRKSQLLSSWEYADVAYYEPETWMYRDMDQEPGLDGSIPEDWNRLPLLEKVDLSGNSLSGSVPDTFMAIPLTEMDLSDNGEALQASAELYQYLAARGLNLDGIAQPYVEPEPTEEPTEEPIIEPTEEPFIEPTEAPTEEPWQPEPPVEQPTEPSQDANRRQPFVPDQPEPPAQPTEQPLPPVQPTAVPTQEPPKPAEPTQRPPRPSNPTRQPQPQPIIIVVTATPAPQWYTATPQYYPYQPYPNNQQYPDYQQYPQYQQYPTATPYNNYAVPGWVYPTATVSYSYPVYGQPTQPAQPVSPTQDPASMLGFTYVLEEMTGNAIPMTWRYTGMQQYSINYLDAQGNLYPAFAMEWKPASELCNASVCNATVENIPEELLRGGTFSLQLRVQDASGRTYISDPIQMQVSMPEPIPEPTPEPPASLWQGFFEWLFGPIIRLFGGGK